MKYVVAALYHLFEFQHYADLQPCIKAEFIRLGIKGTLLLTPEGINGTLAGTREAVDGMIAYLRHNVTGAPFDVKESLCDYAPFKRIKVKLRQETISLGESAPLSKRGQYVSPQEWNGLIADPDTVVIDTRNAYEVAIGSFERALNPRIENFKQLPDYMRAHFAYGKQKKIATFCTGGIRCEKFTAWLSSQGYEHVYHLKGGILNYIEKMPQADSKWRGECFVFDDRRALDHTLVPMQAEAQKQNG